MFQITPLLCPACKRGKLEAAIDRANAVWLTCQNDKCGTITRSDVAANSIAEANAKASHDEWQTSGGEGEPVEFGTPVRLT